MRITMQQLRRIIKEEAQRALREAPVSGRSGPGYNEPCPRCDGKKIDPYKGGKCGKCEGTGIDPLSVPGESGSSAYDDERRYGSWR